MTGNNDKKFQELHEKIISVGSEVRKVIIGQTDVIRSVLICLISEGHVLLEGVPGIGKTKMVNILRKSIRGAKFQRIQGTPDLLPSDITGTRVFEPDTKSFAVEEGPIVTNLLLIDEINRTTPKTQSALLEAMQELQFTIANETYRLERPFMVLATQNPIEQEGTYPLPEAQIDRFMMKIEVGYPSKEEELEIVDDQVITGEEEIRQVMSCEDIIQLRSFLKEEGGVYVDPKIKKFIVDIVSATRPENNGDLSSDVMLGASPRASIYLTDTARSNAFLAGRDFVSPEDVLSVVYNVLRHRILLRPTSEEPDTDKIIQKVLEKVRKYG